MDRKTKAAWIKALRSGEYRQGQGVLQRRSKKGPSYCCLGVLATVKGCTWRKTTDIMSEGYVPYFSEEVVGGYDQESTFLRPKFAGLSSATQVTLSNLNDDESYSFEQIADWIEKKVRVTRRT